MCIPKYKYNLSRVRGAGAQIWSRGSPARASVERAATAIAAAATKCVLAALHPRNTDPL